MPKKHHQRALLTKPSSSAPSSLSLPGVQSGDNDASQQKSVNELLRESRKSETNGRMLENLQIGPSVHPFVRATLNMPAPPVVQTSPRTPVRGPNRVRRIPGPPPPQSWLQNSRHAPDKERNAVPPSIVRQRIVHQASILPNVNFPPQSSLQHVALKSMAQNWNWHVEYDHVHLSTLPVGMKEMLLSYICIYHQRSTANSLPVLFPPGRERNDDQEVTRLDLGNKIGGSSTVKQIEKQLMISSKPAPLLAESHEIDIPDSWEEHDPSQLEITTITACRFQNLQHLSLSAVSGVSDSVVLWQDLLSLASKLPTIRSLCLAYWPQPTYTPIASKGRHKIRTSEVGSSPTVIYGGSDFYTAFDGNWQEAAGILRSLSRSLYCLRWLDLTGCAEWFPALVWAQDRDSAQKVSSVGPDWNGSWRTVEHLILNVGWKPGKLVAKSSNAAYPLNATSDLVTEVPSQLSLTRLGTNLSTDEQGFTSPENIQYEREKQIYRKEVECYIELRNSAKHVAQSLRVIRKELGGRWISVDIGEEEEPI